MKIYDIITESQYLAENRLIFLQMLEYAVSKGGVGIEKALAYISKVVIGKSSAPKELAEAWILTAEKAGMTANEAIAAGKEAAKASGVAADVIAAAEREAAAIARARANSIWGRLKTKTDEANFYWGTAFNTINKGLMWWGIGEPIYDCVSGILKVYRMHDEGHPELQDKDKLQWAVQWYIDNAVERVTAILIGRKVIRGVLGPNGIQRIPILNFEAFNKVYNLASPAAQAAFQAWIITDEGQKSLAKWLVGEAMIPGTDWKIPGGYLFRSLITNPLSGIAKSGYDYILRKLGSEKAQQLPEPKPAEPRKSVRRYDLGTGDAKTPSF